MNATIQQSLFPDKGDFSATDFESCFPTELRDIIASAIRKAHSDVISEGHLRSARNKHDTIREYAFENIRQSVPAKDLLGEQFHITSSDSGNQRSSFTYRGYTYLLNKNGATNNRTSTAKVISEQSGLRHYICIEYDTDATLCEVVSVTASYYKGEKAIYRLELINPADEQPKAAPEVKPIAPTILKRKGAKAV